LNKIFLIRHYIRYLLKARNEHWLHSPFAFNLYTKIIKDKTKYPDFNDIESLRTQLKKDHRLIEVTDLGAGSEINNSKSKKISSICKSAEKSPAIAQLIYRIIKNQQPSTLLDLGTSFGLTTLYESRACPSGKIYSFEGCPNTAAIAKNNFEKLSVKNMELVIGNIDQTLPQTLNRINVVDFVFFDANHRYEPTLNYFLQCAKKANEDSIFIFDDIYWSPEMKKAWEEIKGHPSVGMSMDLFFIGIIFFRKKQPVQHFTLK
jgi:predicted O-methyltransferase YrrM